MTTSSKGVPTLVLGALCATGPLSIDMYLPSIPAMAMSLSASEGAIQLSLMTFFVGLMIGQLAYGPLSDKFGRKPLIYLGLAVFVLGSMGCAMATTVTQWQWLRFVQGIGGSIGMVIAFSIARDSYSGPMLGKMMSLILAVLGIAPIIAPLLGTMLQEIGSWRTIFWALMAYGVVTALAAALLLPETRTVESRKDVVLKRTLHNYGTILADKRFVPFAAASCIAQAGFFAYLAGSASVFITEYSLSPTQYSLLFGVNAFGLVAATLVNPLFHRRVGPLHVYRITNYTYFAVLALLMVYLASGHGNLFVLCVGLFVTISLLGFLMPTGSQLALMHQRKLAGTASALMGSMQFGAGAIITGVSGALVAWGSVGLVLIMLACAGVSALICVVAFPRKVQL